MKSARRTGQDVRVRTCRGEARPAGAEEALDGVLRGFEHAQRGAEGRGVQHAVRQRPQQVHQRPRVDHRGREPAPHAAVPCEDGQYRRVLEYLSRYGIR